MVIWLILGCYFGWLEVVQSLPQENLTNLLTGEQHGPCVHTIHNDDPYSGLGAPWEEQGKYPVIFEPLQNVQMSRSTYKVTSFVDFEPYLQYFRNFENYIEAFMTSMKNFGNDPVLREFQNAAGTHNEHHERLCTRAPVCSVQPLLYQVSHSGAHKAAFKWQQERCRAWYMQICMAL